jgi:hypothetical protein
MMPTTVLALLLRPRDTAERRQSSICTVLPAAAEGTIQLVAPDGDPANSAADLHTRQKSLGDAQTTEIVRSLQVPNRVSG